MSSASSEFNDVYLPPPTYEASYPDMLAAAHSGVNPTVIMISPVGSRARLIPASEYGDLFKNFKSYQSCFMQERIELSNTSRLKEVEKALQARACISGENEYIEHAKIFAFLYAMANNEPLLPEQILPLEKVVGNKIGHFALSLENSSDEDQSTASCCVIT